MCPCVYSSTYDEVCVFVYGLHKAQTRNTGRYVGEERQQEDKRRLFKKSVHDSDNGKGLA